MTNHEIICREAVAHGLITKAAAEAAILTGADIPLHTYAAWKSRGYQVRKGEKKAQEVDSDAQPDTTENPEASGHYFLATAFLFTLSQVDEITTH